MSRWRIRVGSSYANSGGVVHNVFTIIINAGFSAATRNNDIAIVRSSTLFTFNNNVAQASIAGANYIVPEYSSVWALGFGQIGVSCLLNNPLFNSQCKSVSYKFHEPAVWHGIVAPCE